MDTNLALTIGWLVLIIANVYIFIKGRHVYKIIKGSMLGKITEALVYSTLVNVSCLGIISTFYLLVAPEQFLRVLMIFVVWFVVFVWSLIVISKANKEARRIVGK